MSRKRTPLGWSGRLIALGLLAAPLGCIFLLTLIDDNWLRVGVATIVFGVVILSLSIVDLRFRRRVSDTPTSSVALAPGGAPIEVKGRIVAGKRGLLKAPFSGRSCVLFSAKVEERHFDGQYNQWSRLASVRRSRAFFLDDGSGERARIRPKGATVLVEAQIAATSHEHSEKPELLEFLHRRGIKIKTLLGVPKELRYTEELLAPGDLLYALGPSKRRPRSRKATGGEPPKAATRLVLEAGGDADAELVLTNMSEETLAKSLLIPSMLGALLLVIGVAALAIGLARSRP